jgi:hypothetical protein
MATVERLMTHVKNIIHITIFTRWAYDHEITKHPDLRTFIVLGWFPRNRTKLFLRHEPPHNVTVSILLLLLASYIEYSFQCFVLKHTMKT